jgi:chemotaxis protein histidine kinase CheA
MNAKMAAAMNTRVKAWHLILAAVFTALLVVLAFVFVPGGTASVRESLPAKLRTNAARLTLLSRQLPSIEAGVRHGLNSARWKELQTFVHNFEATSRSEAAAISRLEHRTAASEGRPPHAALTADREQEKSIRQLQGDLSALTSIEQEALTEQTSLEQYRSTINDEAKSLQSTINQSNDAVDQQSNMASSLIQELSTLLSTIYR